MISHNRKLILTSLMLLGISACSSIVESEQAPMSGNVLVTSEEIGSIYIDGEYTGQKTPHSFTMEAGEYSISVGTENSRQYLKKQLTLTDAPQNVHLTAQDKVAPAVWKALFVGVPTVTGKSSTGECSTHFNENDLDEAFSFFNHNLTEHIEPFSYNTVKWQIDRQDLTTPVELTYNPKNKWYTVEAEQGLAELSALKAGQYDTVFLFWREEQGDCSFKSPYFGLAWLDPTDKETKQTGYVTVKFNPKDIGVKARIDEYLATDPGVWTHEWLHVVIEQFYPNLGVQTPLTPKDKLILHSAQAYGYNYPWIKWYKDLISGQVPLGQKYVGIGPEALLSCSVARTALDTCKK
ncbi:PEGA domain-containing protein [Litorilituus lipolyticus]|uniref:PEGA domain-containing protein n=1 Tax=Litorilituus lipolyticus TaxID=2491017 RepID=A0A502KSI9_9GAMM|nr:PEGA domain-containing protein [Litorilituus lipolyticus]TPH14608.1 PEGA domain-containing protein [Litorilituus lipolyticus]